MEQDDKWETGVTKFLQRLKFKYTIRGVILIYLWRWNKEYDEEFNILAK